MHAELYIKNIVRHTDMKYIWRESKENRERRELEFPSRRNDNSFPKILKHNTQVLRILKHSIVGI